MEMFSGRKGKGVFTATNRTADSLAKNYNIQTEISVVNHSLSDEMLGKAIVSNRDGKLRVLFIGRLVEGKGINVILEIINNLSPDKYEFTFVGKGELEQLVKEVAIEKHNVQFLGFINNRRDVADIMNNHDVLLLPSLRTETWEEVFGLVIIEAMACGNVVISTDHVGPREIIEDGHDGYLAAEREYKNKATEILSYLFDNRDHLQEMKRYAQIKSEKYSACNISRAWDKLLEKHLKR